VNTYDRIGRTYATTRRADPRIAAQIRAALGDARTVVNIGAGTGNYEPVDRTVVAVDPSHTMLRQRGRGAAPAVLGVAEALPFADTAFDAALAVLTVHHWSDLERGLREMRRVAPRQVVFMFDHVFSNEFWLVRDYMPEIRDLDSERPAVPRDLQAFLDVERVESVMVPADCIDGFGGCFWNRPERYLDADVQAGMSCFALLDDAVITNAMTRLRDDLASGVWDARHGALRAMDEIDLGYRLVVAR